MFPLPFRPKESYHERPRAFGSPRDGGKRKHAGCDLYAPPGTDVLAVADGVVLRGPYLFYDGVDALEIEHPGIGVVRYGEIQGPYPVQAGDKVRAGQVIGHVGKMATVPQSMLHFELYAGALGDLPLTNRARPPFMRRGDLTDPTAFLDSCAVKA